MPFPKDWSTRLSEGLSDGLKGGDEWDEKELVRGERSGDPGGRRVARCIPGSESGTEDSNQ
jgi:hypothetical protein